MEELAVILIIFAIGTFIAWRNITRGSGLICSRFSKQTLAVLNSREGRLKKILLAAVLSYLIFGAAFIKAVVWISVRATDGFK